MRAMTLGTPPAYGVGATETTDATAAPPAAPGVVVDMGRKHLKLVIISGGIGFLLGFVMGAGR